MDKVALTTGAEPWTGEAISANLLQKGARFLGLERESHGTAGCEMIQANLADCGACGGAGQTGLGRSGRTDGLVNCAALNDMAGPDAGPVRFRKTADSGPDPLPFDVAPPCIIHCMD